MQERKQLQKRKRVKDSAMKDTECKASNFENAEQGDVDTYDGVSLFEERLSMINCNHSLYTNTKRYTHELLNL